MIVESAKHVGIQCSELVCAHIAVIDMTRLSRKRRGILMSIQEIKRYKISCDGYGCPKSLLNNFGQTGEFYSRDDAKCAAQTAGWHVSGEFAWCEDCVGTIDAKVKGENDG